MSLKEVLPKFATAYPKLVGDLMREDFANYRASLAARYKPPSLNRHVTNVRAMFAWAFRNHVIPDLPRWGDSFEKPSAKTLRKHREQVSQKNGKKMFHPTQIRKVCRPADGETIMTEEDRRKTAKLLSTPSPLANSEILIA